MAETRALIAISVLAAGCAGPPHRAASVTAANVRAIRAGMTETDVVGILGTPLRVRPWGQRAALHDYAVTGRLGQGIACWVYFNRDRVEIVHVEQYYFLRDNRALYERRADGTVFESGDFAAALTWD